MVKPFSAACERNSEPILSVLRQHFVDRKRVVEVGSGTGQHAVHFARALPHLRWQASDVPMNLPGIEAWIEEAGLPNTPAPISADVNLPWAHDKDYDAAFCANVLHIMAWPEVLRLFQLLDGILADDAILAIYGPFNEGGQFTSPSNAEFNRWLHARGAHMAIRDVEAVREQAQAVGFKPVADLAMPANNRMLIWQRTHTPTQT